MLSQTIGAISLAISIIIQIRKVLWEYLNKNYETEHSVMAHA